MYPFHTGSRDNISCERRSDVLQNPSITHSKFFLFLFISLSSSHAISMLSNPSKLVLSTDNHNDNGVFLWLFYPYTSVLFPYPYEKEEDISSNPFDLLSAIWSILQSFLFFSYAIDLSILLQSPGINKLWLRNIVSEFLKLQVFTIDSCSSFIDLSTKFR